MGHTVGCSGTVWSTGVWQQVQLVGEAMAVSEVKESRGSLVQHIPVLM